MPMIIGSIVRHLLTALAGGLLGLGIEEAAATNLVEAATPVVSGALLYGIGQVWSIRDKKKR